MGFATDIFNSRELATILWGVLFLGWAFSKSGVRESFKQLVKAFLSIKILVPILLMILYVSLATWCFYKFNIWRISDLKNTILWTFGVGLVFLFNIDKTEKDNFFKNTAIGSLKITAVLEYLVNLYTFPFLLEFVLVPFVTIVFAMKTVAELDVKYKPIEKLLENVVALYGAAVLFFSISSAIHDSSSFASFESAKSFLLPPVLTILNLPFIYILALYANYESVFVRLSFFNTDEALISYAKKRIILHFHLNLRRLIRWSKRVGTLKVSSKDEVHQFLHQE